MQKRYLAVVLGGLTVGLTGAAQALPVLVDYSSINANTLETFESYLPFTDQGMSQPFIGFTASVSGGVLSVNASPTFCDDSSDQCLTNRTDIGATRTFDSFLPGTAFFGFQLTKVPDSGDDVLRIVANGVSGSQIFDITGDGGLYGFGDTSGLLSLAITNLGNGSSRGNYAVDDVITGLTAGTSPGPDPDPNEVPEPGTISLLGIGLAGLGLSAMRRRRAA